MTAPPSMKGRVGLAGVLWQIECGADTLQPCSRTAASRLGAQTYLPLSNSWLYETLMIGRLLTKLFGSNSRKTFQFQPRWKEGLVVTGPGGSFVLELPMGVYSAYLPTQTAWETTAPDWARDLWPLLKSELEDWCVRNKAEFHIDETATVLVV